MCGIIGAIGNFSKPESLDNIAHRGPDSQGVYSDENVFFGHTRLSIQDLSENGSQPMHSQDGKYIIIFNGEIYNHWDIRKQLEGKYTFNSTSDTETILYAYIEYGSKMLGMLNGIYALAIYNTETQDVIIARDPLGVKPLYYYRDKDKLIFSSEMKMLIPFGIDEEIAPKSIANYLTFLWSPGEATPFEQVKKLIGGYYLSFKVKDFTSAKPVKFYQIGFDGKYLKNTEEEIIDLLDQKLVQSVERQLLSDVPVGFFLSGGLDSSLLVAIARRLYPDRKFDCFTIDTGDLDKTEGFASDLHYARKVADYLKVDLHIVKAEIDIVKDFDKMIWHLDEPQADAAPLNVLNICAKAREMGIKVLIGGAAGDDLFSGYRRHKALVMESYVNKIPLFARVGLKSIIDLLPSQRPAFRRIKKLSANWDKNTLQRMSGYFSWLPRETLLGILSDKYRKDIETYYPTEFLENLNSEIPEEKNLLNRMLYWELRSFLVDHNLNYTDKLSMAVGVEARVPFLDLELVEFSTKIPPALKLKNGETKYILKKVAERYLPNDVIYRPKTGFGAPVRQWVLTNMEEMINTRLSKDRLSKRGIFNPDKVWNLIEDNKNGKIDASYIVWSILAIDSWMEQFYKKEKSI